MLAEAPASAAEKTEGGSPPTGPQPLARAAPAAHP
jgi:hypothetical protein